MLGAEAEPIEDGLRGSQECGSAALSDAALAPGMPTASVPETPSASARQDTSSPLGPGREAREERVALADGSVPRQLAPRAGGGEVVGCGLVPKAHATQDLCGGLGHER